MTAPVDDWSAFAGNEHMFFGLDEPFAFIRTQVEESLRTQVADTIVDAIVTSGRPKHLTLGRRVDGDARTSSSRASRSRCARTSTSPTTAGRSARSCRRR
jgi:hypothetical protein